MALTLRHGRTQTPVIRHKKLGIGKRMIGIGRGPIMSANELHMSLLDVVEVVVLRLKKVRSNKTCPFTVES